MEVVRLLSRKQLAWLCLSQAKKTIHSGAKMSFSRKINISSCFRPNGSVIHHNSRLESLNLWEQPVIRGFASDSPPTSDKQDKSSPGQSQAEPAPEEKVPKEEVEAKSIEESPRVEKQSTEELEPEKSGTPEDREDPDPENKLDKLYKAIELEVLAYEPAVLDSYQWFVITAATHLGIKVGKCWSPPNPDKKRFNLLKSAFVHKKHQVHYEVRTHHRFLTFHKLTSSTADTFLEYIERNLPEGVGLKVTRVEAKPIPEYLLRQAGQQ